MRSQYDIAYGCFLFVGAGVLAMTLGAVFRIPVSEGTLAFGGIWFGVLGILALLTGFGYSLVLWRHYPMRLLALSSVLFVGTWMLEDALSTAVVNAVSVLYGLGSVALSVRWFVTLRRRFQ